MTGADRAIYRAIQEARSEAKAAKHRARASEVYVPLDPERDLTEAFTRALERLGYRVVPR